MIGFSLHLWIQLLRNIEFLIEWFEKEMIIHCELPASKKSAEVHWRVKLTCRLCKEDEKSCQLFYWETHDDYHHRYSK